MTWIRVDLLMPGHPKIGALAEALEVTHREAIGLLVQTWTYAGMYHINGDLSQIVKSHFSNYLGGFDSVRLTVALHACGWLDADGRLHDWDEYQGVEICRRERNAKYMQEYRMRQKEESNTPRKTLRNGSRKGATYVRTYERTNARARKGQGPRAGKTGQPPAALAPDSQAPPVPVAETMAQLKAKLRPAPEVSHEP
jgi:hypothetical protein